MYPKGTGLFPFFHQSLREPPIEFPQLNLPQAAVQAIVDATGVH
jgi:hypothetical protein